MPADGEGIRLTPPQEELWWLPVRFGLFCGGFGAGKSQTAVLRALSDLQTIPGANVSIYEPTYGLHRDIVIPYVDSILQMHYRPHQWKFDRVEWCYYVQGLGKLILRSMANPGRIVGYADAKAHVDEIDTLKREKAELIWRAIMGRNRQKIPGVKNTITAYGTPEGFNFTYHRWGKRLEEDHAYVRAPSASNPHLPDDYIPTLRKHYPDNIVDAYVEGIWTNLTSGTVYRNFDRDQNRSRERIKPREPLYIGQDFNVGAMASVIHVLRDGKAHAVAEITQEFDTPSMLAKVKELYADHPITFYPDASGSARDSTGASKSDLAHIREAGFGVVAPKRNPPVRDRVLAMNACFRNGDGESRYFVNPDTAPVYTDGLEQQVYDDNGLPAKTHLPDDPSHANDAGGYFIHRTFPVRRQTVFTRTIKGM